VFFSGPAGDPEVENGPSMGLLTLEALAPGEEEEEEEDYGSCDETTSIGFHVPADRNGVDCRQGCAAGGFFFSVNFGFYKECTARYRYILFIFT
jgi:hypothetical protein